MALTHWRAAVSAAGVSRSGGRRGEMGTPIHVPVALIASRDLLNRPGYGVVKFMPESRSGTPRTYFHLVGENIPHGVRGTCPAPASGDFPDAAEGARHECVNGLSVSIAGGAVFRKLPIHS